MKITALGHAGLKVETSRATLLIDPWMSPYGAFQASWFQFPDNAHLLDDSNLLCPTAIVISHEHLDHIDPWFLARVAPEVPVIVPHYPSPVLRQKIALGGPRQVIEAEQWEAVEIEGAQIFFVSEPPMNHDSAIIVQADGQSLFNLNDARLFPVQLRDVRRRVGGHVDVFTFQGAGASWFPICYGYESERERELSRQKRLSKLAYCQRIMKIVEPEMGFPFAGPPAFLDPELFPFNAEMGDEGIFPDQGEVADWLHGRGISNVGVLLPGDAWNIDTKSKEADEKWSDFSFENRGPYLQAYAQRRREHLQEVLEAHPIPTESLWPQFQEYFQNLLGLSPYFNEKINMRVGFDILGPGGGAWSVDFRPGQESVHSELGDCGYLYRFESRWLPPILKGEVPWEDFFLTLRFQARRNPDLYNDHLLGLLKFADTQPLKEVEKFETTPHSDERIEVHSEGQTYSVSRYCPHAGNDLLNHGEVLPGGILRCLAHHYDFDLKTGQCLTGNCAPLLVGENAEETAADCGLQAEETPSHMAEAETSAAGH